MSITVGAIVEGEVSGIAKFGAFVQLEGNKLGLIHISEVANAYVKDVHDFLKEHDKVKVKVLSIDERGKIALSLKQVPQEMQTNGKEQTEAAKQERYERSSRPAYNAKPQGPLTFEDKLTRFLKDSDDRMLDLRRNTESKRGGRGARHDR